MSKERAKRIVSILFVMLMVTSQVVLPVRGDEIMIDNRGTTTGGIITAGVASLLLDEIDSFIQDESDILLSDNDLGFKNEMNLIINDEVKDINESLLEEDGSSYVKDSVLNGERIQRIKEICLEEEINNEEEGYNTDIVNSYNASLNTMIFDEYRSNYKRFIEDPKWCNGAEWGKGHPHQIGTWSSSECAAYAHDFICYVYGKDGSFDVVGNKFTTVNEIRTGDVIWITTPLNSRTHYVVVLERNGNDLYTAEGNHAGGDVRIASKGYQITDNGKNLYMNDPGIETGNCVFKGGWHFSDITEPVPDPDPDPNPCDCEMTRGVDKIKNGEYVLVSEKSLDDSGKIRKDNPYVIDIDNRDVVIERKLSSDSPIWEIELIENRFYNIYNRKTDKAMSLEEDSKKRLTNIHVGKYKESDHTAWWSFDEMWPGKFIIENRYSEMCATICSGDSIKQKEFLGKSDCETQTWLLVRPDKPTIKTTTIPNGEIGKEYATSLVGECDEWIAIEWSLANDSGALPEGLSLSKDGVISGTPTKAGDYAIKINATNEFGTTTQSYMLSITGPAVVPVTSVSLSKTSLELNEGGSVTLTASVTPGDATDKTLTWKSSDEKVATVSSTGKVTAVKEGTATITATSNSNKDKSASCKVTVKTKPSGILIKADDVNVMVGKTVSVPVRISGNTGLGGIALTVTNDSGLVLEKIEKGSLLSTGTFNTDTNSGMIQWYTSNAAVKGDGILFTLHFKIKDGTVPGDYAVKIGLKDGNKANVTDENSKVLDVAFGQGKVSVNKRLKGDVTGDGEVAMGDVVKVARGVAGTITLTSEEKEAADVTGDNDVAMGDVVKIARYVAGTINEL